MSLRVESAPVLQTARPVVLPSMANTLTFGVLPQPAAADRVCFGASVPANADAPKDFWATINRNAFGQAPAQETLTQKVIRYTVGALTYPFILAYKGIQWMVGQRDSFLPITQPKQPVPVPIIRPEPEPVPRPTGLPVLRPEPQPQPLSLTPPRTEDPPTSVAIPSIRFADFMQALGGQSLVTAVRGALTVDNVLGRGAGEGFCAIPGIDAFGLKAPIGFGLGGGVTDVSQRLAAVLSKLPDSMTAEALPTRVADLPEASHNVAVIKGPDGTALFTIQNRIPGKNLINLIDDPMSDQDCQHIQSSLMGMMGNHRIWLADVTKEIAAKQGREDVSVLHDKAAQYSRQIKERLDLFNQVATITRKPVSEDAQIDELLATVPHRYIEIVSNVEADGAVDEARLKRLQAKRTLNYVGKSLATQEHYLNYIQMLAKAPPESYQSFLKTLNTLDDRGIGFDFQHSGNVVFDPVSERFGIVDLNERGAVGAHKPYSFEKLVRVLFVKAKGQSNSYLDYMFDEEMGKKADSAARQVMDKLFAAQDSLKRPPLMLSQSVAGMACAQTLYDYVPPDMPLVA